jgi:hypothetical protein
MKSAVVVAVALFALLAPVACAPEFAVGFVGDECSSLQAACSGGSAVVTCEDGVYVEAFACAEELCTYETDNGRVCCENDAGEYACISINDSSDRCVGDACPPEA